MNCNRLLQSFSNNSWNHFAAMKLYLTAQGKPFEIISDIGSGINYKKKRKELKRISQNKVDKVVFFIKTDCYDLDLN